MERRTLPALLASFAAFATALLAALIITAPAAQAAPIDPELVAESINDGGLYVDSSAVHFKGDAAKDKLRAQLETARKPVFVAVVPAGTSLTPTGLYQIVKRKGTYAVLNGDSLKASSNVLSSTQLKSALTGALRTNPGDSQGAAVSFVRLTNGVPKNAAIGTGTAPRPGPSTEAAAPAESAEADSGTPVSATEPAEEGGLSPLIIGGIAAILLAVGTGGLLVWRGSRKKQPRTGPGYGPGPGPGPGHEPGYGPGPGPGPGPGSGYGPGH
jgi:hypothetical protein